MTGCSMTESSRTKFWRIFYRISRIQIRQLRTILRNGDSEGARRRAHAIKGAAASVDGESLRLAALDLERRALAGEQQELAVLADRLEASF